MVQKSWTTWGLINPVTNGIKYQPQLVIFWDFWTIKVGVLDQRPSPRIQSTPGCIWMIFFLATWGSQLMGILGERGSIQLMCVVFWLLFGQKHWKILYFDDNKLVNPYPALTFNRPRNKALWSGFNHWFLLIRPAIRPLLLKGVYVKGEGSWPVSDSASSRISIGELTLEVLKPGSFDVRVPKPFFPTKMSNEKTLVV